VAGKADVAVLSRPSRGLQAAWGIHLGLLLVAGSALYSKQSPPLGPKQLGALVVVAVALILWAALERRQGRVSSGLRLLLGLAAALLLGLARAPRLTTWVAEGQLAGDLLGYLRVNLGTIGVAVVFASWLVYYMAGGEREQPRAPMRRAVVAAGGLVVVLGVLIYAAFFNIYGRRGDLGAGLAMFQALQYVALVSALLGSSGGPLVRRLPAFYLGLALLGTAGLGFLAMSEGGLG